MIVDLTTMQTYLDTGDRVVVRDHAEGPGRHGFPRIVIIVNDELLTLQPNQVELVYEGLRRALNGRALLDEHGLIFEKP